ncbi:hypothetical protein AB6A40_003776 [Gnathostoma spinigerum]|uniref:Anoctamin n=1 Tax=Gnathostoma spinigerum TaxID=75299 RepID=A0ABD6ECS1_9BILA
MYFSDGKRRIDYVLVYEEAKGVECYPSTIEDETDAENNCKKRQKRLIFERNLRKLGLELEHVDGKHINNTKFVLIHAPFDVLLRQAENLSLKMPVQRSDISKERTIMDGFFDRFLKRFKFLTFDEEINKRFQESHYFTAPFLVAHLDCYVGSDDPENFFDSSERSRMVYDLLIRAKYDRTESEKNRVGIERLINNGSYKAAYPLHEDCESLTYDVKTCSNREMLYWKWSRISNFCKYQPLSLIRHYFGSKMGLYFAWLGYYTKVLFPASLIGIICFLYGLLTFPNDIPSNEICGKNDIIADLYMCPVCYAQCNFTLLSASCAYSKLTYVFDNISTVVFAMVMSVGATLFLEGWKRYHAEVAWKWGLLDFEVDEEKVRPEYQLRVKNMKNKRLNPVTQEMEPYIPFRSRLLKFCGSGVAVFFCLLLVLGVVFGIVVYRIILLQVFHRFAHVKAYAHLLTFSTAALINLLIIIGMSQIYNRLANMLTEWECPRTQTEFDNSYTFKVFLFQFVNYYSSIFYVAFIKSGGGVPGREFIGLHPEECDPAGCMVELVIQLGIIMVGKQFWNGIQEVAYPWCTNVLRRWWLRFGKSEDETDEKGNPSYRKRMTILSSKSDDVPRWEKDYLLCPCNGQYLFDEYLEMVIQFGFVTLFVSAFPLAPFFALLNNILEIRLDAYKYTITYRRPMPARAKDIGVWYYILDGISKFAVLVNAFVIAFTSDFIPKFVYIWHYQHDNLVGYMNNSLSVYNSSAMPARWEFPGSENITSCRYRDFRSPPCSSCDDEYHLTTEFYVILVYRLAFVLIFEHIVYGIKMFVAYVIPDIPSRIFIQLQRQRYLARQARLAELGESTVTYSDRNWETADTEDYALQAGQFVESDRPSAEMRELIAASDMKKGKALRASSGVGSVESFHSCSEKFSEST